MGVDVWDILEFGGLEGDAVFGIISKKDIINLDKKKFKKFFEILIFKRFEGMYWEVYVLFYFDKKDVFLLLFSDIG